MTRKQKGWWATLASELFLSKPQFEGMDGIHEVDGGLYVIVHGICHGPYWDEGEARAVLSSKGGGPPMMGGGPRPPGR